MSYKKQAFYENARSSEIGFPFYFARSSNPKRMYPHFHREIELTYFYKSCAEYVLKGKTYRPSAAIL